MLWPETKGKGERQQEEEEKERETQYLDKPCKLERVVIAIGLARSFSSYTFSLAA